MFRLLLFKEKTYSYGSGFCRNDFWDIKRGSVHSSLHPMLPRYQEHILVSSCILCTCILEYWNWALTVDDDVKWVHNHAKSHNNACWETVFIYLYIYIYLQYIIHCIILYNIYYIKFTSMYRWHFHRCFTNPNLGNRALDYFRFNRWGRFRLVSLIYAYLISLGSQGNFHSLD